VRLQKMHISHGCGFVTIGLILGFGTAAARANVGPVQWTVGSGGDGNYYERVDVGTSAGLTYDEAVSDAAAMSYDGMPGELAVLDNSDYTAAFNFIYTNVYSPGVSSGEIYWVGNSNPDPGTGNPDDLWTWLNGEVASSTVVATWNIDYAEGGRGAREGMGYYETGSSQLWDYIATDSNSLSGGYIVEFVPEPTALAAMAVSGLLLLRRRRITAS